MSQYNGYEHRRRYSDSVISDGITATKVLVAANVLVFFLCELIGDSESTDFLVKAGGMVLPDMVESAQYWRLFTSMFLHSGIQHLINNMILLLCFGETLERRLGWLKLTLLYLVSGLVGNVVSLFIYMRNGEDVVSVGASGAVFGVFGGLLAIALINHGRYEYITAKRLGIMTVLALYVGFQSTTTNNIAHFAGALEGFVLGYVLDTFFRRYDIL